ncbi:outer dense fiber protein 3B [Folsomia candida]|uniref:Outer dense fiber protein 3B n=1 Tax=Folsomia candida TaxID=158441 RepID=A0A226F400_FOLCA|nr:outer dense fiber protein 3B [Folsomia candida]OXA64090.1 Outer dense fiber protein 3B [Folsomia candida]
MNKTVEQRQQQLSSFWENGPGPAGVMLPPTIGMVGHDPSRKQNPAYSLGLKLPSVLIRKGNGPGPIYAIPKGMTAKGPDTQVAASLKSRTKVIEPFNTQTPGPAEYLPAINVNRRKAPEYSLAWRTPVIERGKCSPGPIYLLPPCLGPNIPDKNTTGEVTIKGKGKTDDEVFRSPGPIYDIGSPNIIKNKGGEVSIKGRWRVLKGQSCNAGPGSYNVHESTPRVWRQPPAFSIGIRHSPFAGVFMTECDKAESAVPNFDDC